MDLFELTRKLIDIPSVTGEEKEVGDFLASYLQSLGYPVEKQEVAKDRFNVIATIDSNPRAVLSTHMDTVPPYIASSDNGDQILGRGACDAKGIIAAQITAAQRLREQGVDVGLLFTVDEELGSAGARIANDSPIAASCKFLINGEPTDNKLATATKGSLRLSLKTSGRSAHSAYPEHGESAIDKLLDVLQILRDYEWPKDSILGETTCNVGVIGGGTRPNVIPAEANATLQLRLVTSAGQIKSTIEGLIAGRAEVEYLSENDPVHLLTVDGIEQCPVRFTTDIPYLTNWGAPLLLGPGSILNAHTDHEFVEKRELTDAVELYIQLVQELLAGSAASEISAAAEGVVR